MPVTLDWSGWDVEGNLALDEFEALDDDGGDKPVVSCSEFPNSSGEGDAGGASTPAGGQGAALPEMVATSEPPAARPETAPATFLLPAQYKPSRMDKLTRDSILRAFKRSCNDGHISLTWGEDEQGRPRVKLDAPGAEKKRLGFEALRCKLEFEPWLEAALLLELAEKDADLTDILEERAAIRAADGLSDDAETVALMTIGADERMAAREAERAGFEVVIRKESKA